MAETNNQKILYIVMASMNSGAPHPMIAFKAECDADAYVENMKFICLSHKNCNENSPGMECECTEWNVIEVPLGKPGDLI